MTGPASAQKAQSRLQLYSRFLTRLTRLLTKQLSNRFRLVRLALVRRPFLHVPLLLTFILLIAAPIFVIYHAATSPSHSSKPRLQESQAYLQISTAFSKPSLALHHKQLDVSPRHFLPPSLFSFDRVVRAFDQAWRVRRATVVSQSSSNMPPTQTPKTHAQIAFAIQASRDTLALLPRLLSRIHHPRNVYLLHIDAKTPARSRDEFAAKVAANPAYARNVHIIPSEMLTYKGISAVVNSLALMAAALRLHPDWDYYINLSAADYPLLGPDRIAALLARPRNPPGTLNFVWFFPHKEWKPYSFRTRFMYWDPAACGYQSARARLFHMAAQKTNPLDPMRAYVFTKAEAWSILSRPFVQFVARSSYAKRMLLAHQHVLSVSEHLITDILFNHPVWRATVVPDAFRKVVWYFRGRRSGQHPYTLDRGPKDFSFWPDLAETKSLFARKFSKIHSPIMQRIDEQLSGSGRNDSSSSLREFQQERDVFYNRIVKHFDSITQETLKQQGIKWPTNAYPAVFNNHER